MPIVELFDAEEHARPPVPAAPDPTPVPSTPTPPAPKYSARSLRLAEEFGMSKAEIESHSPDELDTAVYNQQLAVNRLAKQMWAADAHRQALERAPASATSPAPPPAPVNPEDEFIGQFTDDKYNPEIVKLAKLTAGQAKALREVQKRESDRDKRDAEVANLSRMEMIDTGFAGLPAKFAKLFGGDAPASEMDKASREWRRRLSALGATGININEAFTQRQLNRALAAAAEAMFGDLVAETVTPAPSATSAGPYAESPPAPTPPAPPKNPLNGRFVSPAEYEAGALARPTDRKDRDEPPGEAKAKKNLAAKLRERGVAVDEGRPGDATIEDFPG